ncbi:hypothetical protein ABLO27_23835 [Roseibium sp. SCPC15]|uniref:hypothetical protein n=1 Tax=Roseibium sp. SCP15 TaxID=3141376 RepID=UPI003334DEE4
MKHTRQISLHDRLSAMFRGLTRVAVAAMVFSLVFVSPLIDMKDTIAAAAQSASDRSERRSERAERKAERRAERNERRSERRAERAERRSERQSQKAERRSESRSKSEKNSSSSKASSSSNVSTNNKPEADIPSNSGPTSNSGAPAPEKPASGNLINRILGEPRFSGDSEPSGGALSKREEREAIQNGWQ